MQETHKVRDPIIERNQREAETLLTDEKNEYWDVFKSEQHSYYTEKEYSFWFVFCQNLFSTDVERWQEIFKALEISFRSLSVGGFKARRWRVTVKM